MQHLIQLDIAIPYAKGGILTFTVGINERTSLSQYTPLVWAIIRDNKRMFYKLLEQGSDVHVRVNSPNRKDWWNWTLLHTAAQSIIEEDPEVSSKLLDLGEQPWLPHK